MDDTTPTTPESGSVPPVAIPNPHSGEAIPPAQEGMRPEAQASREAALETGSRAALPEQDEPGGPLGALVGAVSTQAVLEATPAADPSDSDLLASMGVESEGIESGQILGLVAGVVVSIVALAVVLVYLFIIPTRQQAGTDRSNVSDYPELDQITTEGRAKTSLFARNDSLYQIPVENAMSAITAQYSQGGAAPVGQPSTRQQWNTLMINRGSGATVQPSGSEEDHVVLLQDQRLSAASGGASGVRADSSRGVRIRRGSTNEEVGTDNGVTEAAPTTLGDAQYNGE